MALGSVVMSGVTLLDMLGLIGCLVLGLAAGAAYFGAMWWSAELFADRGRATLAIALSVGRFTLILAVLGAVATQFGALSLLVTALGILVARFGAMRRVKAMVP
jgi:F1F0 ATPase subunit 2